MYATVRRYEGVTNPSEAAQRVNEGFLSLISKVPGFVAYYWVDAGSGVMISTSVFRTKPALRNQTGELRTMYGRNLVSVLPNPPQITAGEVVAESKIGSAIRFEDFAHTRCFGQARPCLFRVPRAGISFSCQPTSVGSWRRCSLVDGPNNRGSPCLCSRFSTVDTPVSRSLVNLVAKATLGTSSRRAVLPPCSGPDMSGLDG
jgi:hypothetical protein